MVIDSETEKNQTSLKNKGRQIKRTGYESTTKNGTHTRNKSHEKNTTSCSYKKYYFVHRVVIKQNNSEMG